MDDDENPNPSGSRHQLSFSLERDPILKDFPLSNNPRNLTQDDIKKMDEIAQNLSKHGCSFLESTVCSSNGCPKGMDQTIFNETLRKDAKFLHEKLNIIMGYLEIPASSHISLPTITSLSDVSRGYLKVILSGNGNFEDFINKLKKYHSALRCNVVWRQNTVAYRCHTCGLNSCMSLCAQCFEEADHEGHDYSRFFSTVGGCCDCGNPDVMDPKGFCGRHCEGAPKLSDNIPPHSLALLKTVIAKLISRTLVCLRRWCIFKEKVEEYYRSRDPGFNGSRIATNDIINRGILPIINFITEISDAGSAVTDILIEFLLDKNFYHELCRKEITSGLFDYEDVEAPDWRLLPELKQDIDSLANLRLIRSPATQRSLLHPLAIDCVLDELILYLIRIAFPQELIDMLLNLLYDTKYKEHFAKKFFSYYPYITAMVAELLSELPSSSREGARVAERIVHISVQICSGSNICSWLQKEIDIIQCVLRSAIMMSVHKARPIQINHSPERFFSTNPGDMASRYLSEWLVVSIEENPFYEKNADLFVLTDTQNLLVHQPIAKTIFGSENLIEMYIRHVELFQGFTTEWRIASGDHRTHDWVLAAQRSYNVEFEACSLPMHNLLQHVTTSEDCQMFYDHLLESLNTWFKAIKLDKSPTDTNTPPYAITFHLPLHRHLATLIYQMQTHNCADLLSQLIKNEKFLRKLILHPIRIHVARAQYYAGMWLRNGQGMRIAVSHYCKPTITFSFQSADLIILRFAASNINQEYFLTCIINSFSLLDCFGYPDDREEIDVSADSRNLVTRKSWVSQLLDGALRLLLDLIIGRRDTEPDSNELVKEEMITLLARQDLPYSHVKAVIPSRGNICFDKQMEVFDDILNEVANFVEPDQDNSLQHGRYELKKEYFDSSVCPVFCRLRSFGGLDYSEFVNRVDIHEREKSTNLPTTVSPWLGYRMYNFDQLYSNRFENVKSIAAILTQPSFFALMHNIISKVLTTDYYYSLVLQQAIYLLTLSIQFIKSKVFLECKARLYHPNEYNEPAFFTAASPDSVRESENPQKAVIKFLLKNFEGDRSLLVMLVELFIKSAKAQCPNATDRHIFELLKQFLDPVEEEQLVRIHGAGMEYVGRLLNILLKLDFDIRREVFIVIEGALAEPVESVEMEVDSPSTSAPVPSPSDQAAADRKAALKAKKEAYLKKLQAKNSQMMKHHMVAEGISQEEMNKFDTKTIKESTYQCPICSETTNHSLSNPIGLFVHTRPHAVIPNSLSADEPITDIMQLAPSSSSSPHNRLTIQPRRRFFDKRDKLCIKIFSKAGTASVKSLRFRTGIEVRTCNHFAHLSCFKSYVDSIRNNPSPVVRIDFNVNCPMCRTPINTILPLKMEYGREKIAADFDISDLNTVFDIKEFYSRRLRDPRPIFNDQTLQRQSTEYRQAYEDFEDIAYRQLRSCYETPDSIDLVEKRFKGYSARLGFVQSNIDKLIMFTTMGLPLPSFTKGSVLEHILSGAITLSLNIDQDQILTQFYWLMDSFAKANYDGDSEMPPLLICDYQSVYLRCVALPLIDERFVDDDRKAYCLLLYRIMTTLCLTRAIQNTISKSTLNSPINDFIQTADFGFADIISQSLQKVFQILRPLLAEVKDRLLAPHETFDEEERQTFTSVQEMIEYTKKQAEHILSYFLKFVFMLNKEVTKTDLTAEEKAAFQTNDISGLHQMIAGADSGDFAVMASSSRYFLEQLILSLINGEKISQILVSETFNWRYRQLLNLPKEYDKLFSSFFGQKCENCHKQPKHQMLCLLCGSIMCLNKCNEADDHRSNDSETYIERHTISCGAGCCCYLSLNSTMIVINYYRVAVLWGTVYMDSHGEEDRNLIRGKPLFLSENRIKQLQRCWLTQDLENRSNLRWFSLDQLSLALKQSHHSL